MAKKQYNVKTSAVAATERRARKYGVAGGSAYVAGGYIDMAGDVAGKLDRGVFESMFERIVTGTDDDGNEKWYIKAKATLVSVGDVVAYGVSDITGGAGGSSTLANLKDVLLGTLKDGDVIKWDASLGKWVNSQGGGGLDEDSLAAYLTANNYVTSAALGDYVTVDTEQTISGKKTFGAGLAIANQAAISFANPNAISFDIYGNLYRNSQGATNWSIYDTDTTSKILDVDMRTGDLLITGNFIKSGGTSSQFLKADGSVDGTTYATIANLDKYLYSFGGSDFDPATYDGYYVGMTTKSGISGDWWHILSMGWGDTAVIGNKTWVSQLALPTRTNKGVYYRAGNGALAYGGWTKLVDASGDTMTGLLKVPSIELTTISGIKFTNNILGGGGDVAKMYITGTGEAQQLTFEVQNDADDIINFITPDNNGLKKNGNTIWHAGNDGSGSGLDADLLDGYHGSQYLLCNKYWNVSADAVSNGVGFCYANGAPTYGPVVDFGCGSGYNLQFNAAYSTYYGEMLHYRTKNGDTDTWNPWCQIARITDNVASATVLQNTRYLWGQAFNGGGDVNGTFYYNNGDGTLKIYGIAPQSYGHETVAIQTAFDAQDPETSHYPYTYPDRNVLTLQPRGGRVGIGLANPSCMLHVNGTILANGDVTAYSDARLKSDIRPLTNRGFVEPKTYIKDGKRSIGFLAQDVMAIYPELVTDTGGADHWLALNYGNLVAVLEAQIIDHEERIKRLEERV